MSALTQTANSSADGEDPAYAFFQKSVKRLAGIDLTAYKSQQMVRRLNTMMARTRTQNLYEYAKLLEKPERLQEFLDFFTINVSEFLRIPEKFEYLQSRVLPDLLSSQRELRVWSAGCSNGAEPYSVAMLLDELAPSGRWSVLATDVDRTTLARAQRGDGYSEQDLRNVSPARLSRYFTPDGRGYSVKDALKRRIRFQAHDLLKDPFPAGFGLVLCRHVVIYFTEEAKDLLYRKLRDSLTPGGYLFVGGTEIVSSARALGLNPVAVGFYRNDYNRNEKGAVTGGWPRR